MIEVIKYKFHCGIEAVISLHEKASALMPLTVDYWVGDKRLIDGIETVVPPEQLIKMVLDRRPTRLEIKETAEEFKEHLRPMLARVMAQRLKLNVIGVLEL